MKVIKRIEVFYQQEEQSWKSRAVYENPEGLYDVTLPQFPENAKISFTVFEKNTDSSKISFALQNENENNGVTFSMPNAEEKVYSMRFPQFVQFQQAETGVSLNLLEDEKETIRMFKESGEEITSLLDGIEINNVEAPYIDIYDVTEQLMLDFPALTMEMLGHQASGLWTDNGERAFQIQIHHFPYSNGEEWKTDLSYEKIGDGEIWDIADGVKPHSEKIKLISSEPDSRNADDQYETTYICSIDTGVIGQQFLSSPNSRQSVQMRFSVRYDYPESPSGQPSSELFDYAFHVYFNKLNHENDGLSLLASDEPQQKQKIITECLDRNSKVAIDFGTSSTCAAISSGSISMIEMSPDIIEGNDTRAHARVYENPTALMVYDWDALCSSWIEGKKNIPLIIRWGKDDYKPFSAPCFDYGENVKNMLKRNQNKRNLDAVITELKMLPQRLEKGEQLYCIPYEGGSQQDIVLPCGENENNRTFDPIAFYAYLLGKAINHPNDRDNKFYTQYVLTFPVKFETKLRDQLFHSIQKGLLCSLPEPIRRMKDDSGKPMINISMANSEPVACLGACCDYELQLKENGSARLFGVFDFGGGTADFSYGMYRAADEVMEGGDVALELFGDGGDASFGGEILIRRMTYWILTRIENREQIVNSKLYFERPENEPEPDGYSGLISKTAKARSNMRTIAERITRPYFEGLSLQTATGEIDPVSRDSEPPSEAISFEFEKKDLSLGEDVDKVIINVDFSELHKKLSAVIKNQCTLFHEEMKRVFQLPNALKKMELYGAEFNEKDICILMSGNSSRHPMVKQFLSEIFAEENVKLVGEEPRENAEGLHYKVTPKTAVAFGSLMLDMIVVNQPAVEQNESNEVFQFYIARDTRRGKDTLLERNSNSTEWKLVSAVKDGNAQVYVSNTNEKNNGESWKPLLLNFPAEYSNQRNCFIRSRGRNVLEYTAVPLGETPDVGCEVNEIVLK